MRQHRIHVLGTIALWLLVAPSALPESEAWAKDSKGHKGGPPDHAPAHGYRRNRDDDRHHDRRGQNDRDWKRDRDHDRGDWNRHDRDRGRNHGDWDRNGRDRDHDRGDWNRNDRDWHRRNGDRDRRNGDWNCNDRDWNRDRNYRDRDDRNQTGSIDIQGTVTAIHSSDQFSVRSGARTYTVDHPDQLPSSVSVGDVLHIQGTLSSGTIAATRVAMVRNSNGNGTNHGSDVNFAGTVTNVTTIIGGVTVRGDNGRSYQVRSGGATNLSRGDRVRVIGTYRNGVVVASSIRRI